MRKMTLNGWPIPVNRRNARRLLENWGATTSQKHTELQPNIIAKKLALLGKGLGMGAAAILAPMMLNEHLPGLEANETVKNIAMLLASVGGAKGMAILEDVAERARQTTSRLHQAD